MLKKLIGLVMILGLTVTSVSAFSNFSKWGNRVDFYQENGYKVFFFQEAVEPAPYATRIDKYIFAGSEGNVPYQLGIYVQKDDSTLDLNVAYEKGDLMDLNVAYEKGIVVDLPALINAMESKKISIPTKFVSISGDSNKDGEITIVDALEIQKVLSDVKYVDTQPQDAENKILLYLHDFTLDDAITIQDTLLMQKYVAGFV